MRMCTALAAVAICLTFLCGHAAAAPFSGKVIQPAYSGTVQQHSTTITLTDDAGRERSTHCLPDGSFAFPALPHGSYLLDVGSMRHLYPQFRVDVPAKAGSDVVVSAVSGSKAPLPAPPVLAPLGEMKYYQPRKPVDVKKLLFSPYGIMICIAIFAIVVMPNLKVDPEEYKKMQEEMKDSPWAGLMGIKEDAASATKQVKSSGSSKRNR